MKLGKLLTKRLEEMPVITLPVDFMNLECFLNIFPFQYLPVLPGLLLFFTFPLSLDFESASYCS